MKTTLFMLFCFVGFISANDGYAQKVLLNIASQDKTVNEVLNEIEQKTEFTFFYNNRQIDVNRRVSIHGAVPLITNAEFTTEVLSVKPSAVKDVYTLIESDLNNAISLLGDSRRNGQLGRPNKGVALGMLAEVYLAEAGWPLKDTSKYALAASTAKQVLDNRSKYGFDFENSYNVLYWNNDADTGNKEDMQNTIR